MEYGIQLYSVKNFMAKDVRGTLCEPAADKQMIEAKVCIDYLKSLEA